MNLKALQCCAEIVRQGSFTKAAQTLHIAQPALSMAVSRLEDELGVLLFNRVGRKASVTAEGGAFLKRVEAALLELEMARQELRDMAEGLSGEVRLGVPPMFGIRYVPALLSEFRMQHPGTVMTVVEGSAKDISERLEAREIDLALLESRRVISGWDSVLLGEDEMVLCMSSNHPLANEPHLEGRHLQDIEMIVFDRTFLQRHMLDDFCAAAGVSYRIALQSNFVSLVTQSTRDGIGVSTLLRSVQELEPGVIGIPFRPAQKMSFSLCWRGGEYLSYANRRFVTFAQGDALLQQ
ncbi:LysR family transcriptional regulator [Pseudomonas oryzihabitans]|uniref:LysR family transcriptional regulator n=1 Tax=Pseudomonas oryzihabitans TaxID=47885 RepID=A0ABX3ISC7_9PSED|nr:LysR family transcriptional regulator [Pseudomonas psychrotolerans]ONN71259.1 LysR family transcriptional regulator [Pseudomonas psychrotolerans]